MLHNLNYQMDNILHPNQHGFRKTLSCSTQLVTVTHDIASHLDSGLELHAAVLDFSKAFDLVPHHLLIKKLIDYNINPIITRWVASFLSGRSQSVVLDGVSSGRVPVTSGVPQGSVLGPALFLIYINDIVETIEASQIRLFADDTLVYRPVSSASDSSLFQRDLENLYQWSKSNLMRFNASKSNIIVFSSKVVPSYSPLYSIGGENLMVSDSVKYLGVHFHKSLSWNLHIDSVVAKAARTLGLLKHTLYDAEPALRKLAYFSLCRSGLEYGAEAWDPYLKFLTHKLEMLQNKAIRFIFKIKGRDVSISNIREVHNIQTLEARRHQQRHKLFSRFLTNSQLHPTLMDVLTQMSSNNLTMSTRSKSTFNPVHCRTNLYHQSFLPRTTRELRTDP